MKVGLILRKSHRYIALIISLQLLAWSISGIYFTWNNIDEIRGNHLWQKPTSATSINPVNIDKTLQKLKNYKAIESISKLTFLNSPAYHLTYIDEQNTKRSTIYDIKHRKLHYQLSIEQINKSALLQSKLDANIISTEFIESTDSHHEYRGKSLPIWSVQFDDPENTVFYIDPKTAEIKSVRHDSWRWFDFLWMLHTMDYEGRDDFGNLLIKTFSIIAFITALSGIILFILSSIRLRQSKNLIN